MSSKLRQPLVPCETEALKLLGTLKIAGQAILEPCVWWVDSESILFTREGVEAFTAWTDGDVGRKSVLRIDDGFVAEY